jgi:aryl-alcohol dehydrogenase-like predicted oxidoreductase
MWGGVEEKEAERAILCAIDHGITLIDTAPAYGFGRSEEIVGRALQGHRDEVVLATKCGLIWDRAEGEFFFASDDYGRNAEGERRIHRFLGPASIRLEVEGSLRRLRTETIDLFQTHWPDPTTPIAESMEVLLQLKQEGKIRAIGICNTSADQMAAYGAVGQLDSDQEKFSMLDRAIERDQLPYCREHGLAVLAYSPLSLGLLTGRIRPDREYGRGDLRVGNPRFTAENLQRITGMLDELRPLAVDKGLSLAQLVIAWTLAQPGLTHALVGARSPEQAKENAGAGVVLSSEELAAVDAVLSRHSVSP